MNTTKFFTAIAWLVISLFIIIGFKSWGWLPHPIESGNESIIPLPFLPSPLPPMSPQAETNLEQNTSAPVTPSGLVQAWDFDEGGLDNIRDSNGVSLSTYNGFELGTGNNCVQGDCLVFKKANNNSFAVYAPTLPSYSLSGWIRLTSLSSAERQIFNAYGDSVGLTLLDNKLLFYDGQSTIGKTTLEVGNFYHVVVTHDGSTKTIYLNAQPEARTFGQQTLMGGKAAFGSTSSQNGRFFDGVMDEFRLYDHALSNAEVMGLYTEWQNPAMPTIPEMSPATSTVHPSLNEIPLAGGDLSISEFSVNGHPFDFKYDVNGSNLKFTAYITNTGTKDIFVPSLTRFNVICMSPACKDQILGGMSIGTGTFTLKPGEMHFLEMYRAQDVNLIPGIYDIHFVMDPDNLIPEDNKINNTFIVKLRIT